VARGAAAGRGEGGGGAEGRAAAGGGMGRSARRTAAGPLDDGARAGTLWDAPAGRVSDEARRDQHGTIRTGADTGHGPAPLRVRRGRDRRVGVRADRAQDELEE